MSALTIPITKEMINAENRIAALLTIIPGLGHIYKGHYGAGFLWMFFGMPLAVWVGILLGLATAGIGLVFPIVCWVGLAFDAYNEKDRRVRKHHLLIQSLEDGDEVLD